MDGKLTREQEIFLLEPLKYVEMLEHSRQKLEQHLPGVRYIFQLASLSEQELRSFRFIGDRAFSGIEDMFKRKGLDVGALKTFKLDMDSLKSLATDRNCGIELFRALDVYRQEGGFSPAQAKFADVQDYLHFRGRQTELRVAFVKAMMGAKILPASVDKLDRHVRIREPALSKAFREQLQKLSAQYNEAASDFGAALNDKDTAIQSWLFGVLEPGMAYSYNEDFQNMAAASPEVQAVFVKILNDPDENFTP